MKNTDYMILLNHTHRLPEGFEDYRIILNNYDALGWKGQKVRLRPYQAVVLSRL